MFPQPHTKGQKLLLHTKLRSNFFYHFTNRYQSIIYKSLVSHLIALFSYFIGKQNVPIHPFFKRLFFITTAFKYIRNPWSFFDNARFETLE